jgi:hypothetical protein
MTSTLPSANIFGDSIAFRLGSTEFFIRSVKLAE